MGYPIARLLVRGTLVQTAEGLSDADVQEVQKHCQIVWDDHELDRTKIHFCSKLMWKLPTAFSHLGSALQEVWLCYWRTTVSILFHRPKKLMADLLQATCSTCRLPKTHDCKSCEGSGSKDEIPCVDCSGEGMGKPDPQMECRLCGSIETIEIDHASLMKKSLSDVTAIYTATTGLATPKADRQPIDDPVIRRKFYKSCLWGFLKQHIQENQHRQFKTMVSHTDYAEKVAAKTIKEVLSGAPRCKFKEKKPNKPMGISPSSTTFSINTNLLPLREVMRLREIHDQMVKYNVMVDADGNEITVKKIGKTDIMTATILTKAKVNFLNMTTSGADDSDNKSSVQQAAQKEVANRASIAVGPRTSHAQIEMEDGLTVIRERLHPTAQKIFDVITDPPEDYSFSIPVRRSNVCRYLGLPKKEVDRAWKQIESATRSAGLGP